MFEEHVPPGEGGELQSAPSPLQATGRRPQVTRAATSTSHRQPEFHGEADSGGTGSTTGTLRKGRTERPTVLGPEGNFAWEPSEWGLCARVVARASVTCRRVPPSARVRSPEALVAAAVCDFHKDFLFPF